MKELDLEQEGYDNLSDEDFLKSYERHNKNERRSNKYTKEKQNDSEIMFWFFLGIIFLISYFIFSKFLFPPKI